MPAQHQLVLSPVPNDTVRALSSSEGLWGEEGEAFQSRGIVGREDKLVWEGLGLVEPFNGFGLRFWIFNHVLLL